MTPFLRETYRADPNRTDIRTQKCNFPHTNFHLPHFVYSWTSVFSFRSPPPNDSSLSEHLRSPPPQAASTNGVALSLLLHSLFSQQQQEFIINNNLGAGGGGRTLPAFAAVPRRYRHSLSLSACFDSIRRHGFGAALFRPARPQGSIPSIRYAQNGCSYAKEHPIFHLHSFLYFWHSTDRGESERGGANELASNQAIVIACVSSSSLPPSVLFSGEPSKIRIHHI